MLFRQVVKIFEKLLCGRVGDKDFFHYEFAAFAGTGGREGLKNKVV